MVSSLALRVSRLPLRGVWPHFYWRAASVWSKTQCLDGEHCYPSPRHCPTESRARPASMFSIAVPLAFGFLLPPFEIQEATDIGLDLVESQRVRALLVSLNENLIIHAPHTCDVLTHLARFECLGGVLRSSVRSFSVLTEWPKLGAPGLDVCLAAALRPSFPASPPNTPGSCVELRESSPSKETDGRDLRRPRKRSNRLVGDPKNQEPSNSHVMWKTLRLRANFVRRCRGAGVLDKIARQDAGV